MTDGFPSRWDWVRVVLLRWAINLCTKFNNRVINHFMMREVLSQFCFSISMESGHELQHNVCDFCIEVGRIDLKFGSIIHNHTSKQLFQSRFLCLCPKKKSINNSFAAFFNVIRGLKWISTERNSLKLIC